MHKRLVQIKMLLAVLILFLSRQAFAQMVSKSGMVRAGIVGGHPISNYATDRLQEACHLLQNGRATEAATLFEQDLQQHPNELISFIGLMQAKPSLWEPEIKRLEKELGLKPEDPTIAFKLGVLIYYRWAVQDGPHIQADMPSLMRARSLFAKTWDKQKTMLTGSFLCHSNTFGPNRIDIAKIEETLLAQMAGEAAVAGMKRAKQIGWKASPPSMQAVPADNLRYVTMLLHYFRAKETLTKPYLVSQNGKDTLLWTPPTEDQKRAGRYFDEWLLDLKIAQKK
jgi:hypothetical protein